MKLSDFDYNLPDGLIAQHPLPDRHGCRLMVLDRKSCSVKHINFTDILQYFSKGDCLVLNNTKVIPARLLGRRDTGGKVEIFILEYPSGKECVCEALVKPSGRVKDGERILLDSGDEVEVLERRDIGRTVRFPRPVNEVTRQAGHVPLPPYITRPDEESDKSDYQTVYGSVEGATASPTAGLHFTDELLQMIRAAGVDIAYVTLHTNYGTFAPIKCDDIEQHVMHKEAFELGVDAQRSIIKTRRAGGSVWAVGTTSTRVLEHCASHLDVISDTADLRPCSGQTGIYIYPGYKFRVVDHLITNFHLPKSTLMLLVSAFAGREFIMGAYRQAIESGYRFFSYGDSMLIL